MPTEEVRSIRKVREGQIWIAETTRVGVVVILILGLVKTSKGHALSALSLSTLLDPVEIDGRMYAAGTSHSLRLSLHEIEKDFRLLCDVDDVRHETVPKLSTLLSRRVVVNHHLGSYD